jgi:hypothetical protein
MDMLSARYDHGKLVSQAHARTLQSFYALLAIEVSGRRFLVA